MPIAVVRRPGNLLDQCETTFVTRCRPDVDLALKQHASYREALSRLGFSVRELPFHDGLPDSVFVEDTAVALPEVTILGCPGAISRQPEIALIEPEISGLNAVMQIVAPATLEGGDVLKVGRKLFVGLSSRTNMDGCPAA